jgi:hypothetical protein
MAAIAIAIGVWWNANTISHIFIHRPFRSRAASASFAAVLTALLGFPQSVWRDRHLAHHRGAEYRFRISSEIAIQGAVLISLWALMALRAPAFFISAYVPGLVGGLLLCAVHGHYEHAGGTTSHYGRLYNLLCFNDGYHVEHHRHPSAPWWKLPEYRQAATRESRWPAPLRWLQQGGPSVFALVTLERMVLHSRLLQRWVVRTHARAFRVLLGPLSPPRDIAIVGGGLFPRTAIVLRELFPDARITIIDASRANLECARRFLQGAGITFVHHRVIAPKSEFNLNSRLRSSRLRSSRGEARGSAEGAKAADICSLKCDLAVFPLSFDGDRSALYARPPARAVIVHDWMWSIRGNSCMVSPMLLKRLNLVES